MFNAVTSIDEREGKLDCIIVSGSAGNGKTTCLLRAGLQRAGMNDKVVFIAATAALARSFQEDLSREPELQAYHEIVVLQNLKEMMRAKCLLAFGKSGLPSDLFLSRAEVENWLKSTDFQARETTLKEKITEGDVKATAEWLHGGAQGRKEKYLIISQ